MNLVKSQCSSLFYYNFLKFFMSNVCTGEWTVCHAVHSWGCGGVSLHLGATPGGLLGFDGEKCFHQWMNCGSRYLHSDIPKALFFLWEGHFSVSRRPFSCSLCQQWSSCADVLWNTHFWQLDITRQFAVWRISCWLTVQISPCLFL